MPQSQLYPQFAQTRNWLVFRLSHLGDVVLTTGVLAQWGKSYGMRFHVVTKTPWREVFVQHPFVEKTIGFDDEVRGFPAEILRMRRIALEYQGWGLLDLHGTLRSRMLSLFWKGPVARYPKMSMERRMLLSRPTRQISETLCALRVPQRYALALETQAPPAAGLLPCIFLTEEEKGVGRSLLQACVGEGNRPVALHPFATHAWKSWPQSTWLELADRLRQNSIPFVVIGRGEPLFPGQPFDLTNATSLRETCAVLGGCRCLVTGDSGPMHLATAVGTPVVAMFGPTVEEWGFYPSGPDDIVLERSLDCRPCSLHGKGNCPHAGQCLREISPEMVMSAILRQEAGRVHCEAAGGPAPRGQGA